MEPKAPLYLGCASRSLLCPAPALLSYYVFAIKSIPENHYVKDGWMDRLMDIGAIELKFWGGQTVLDFLN